MTNVARCSSNKAYERKAALLFVFFSFSRAIVFHQSSPLPSRKVDSVFRSHAVQGPLLLDKTGDGPELQLLVRTVCHVDVGCFFFLGTWTTARLKWGDWGRLSNFG